MRRIEAAADANGITYAMMFERVGLVVAGRVRNLLAGIHEPRVTILVGAGNNGGDGLEVALRLTETEDIAVGVYLVKPRPDNDTQLQAVRETNAFVVEAWNDQQHRVLRNMVASSNLVIDAIFGIGVRLPLADDITPILRNAVQALDAQPAPTEEGLLIEADRPHATPPLRPYVLALDCPSGVDCDTGAADRLVIPADETITFIAVKQGLLLEPAANLVGKLSVATLNIPETHLHDEPTEYAHADMVRALLPARPTTSHKGTHGKVMIVAGSVNYTGAAGLATLAAYRTGSGLVTLAAPMAVIGSMGTQMLEPTWVLLPQDMGVVSEKAADVIAKELDGYNALLIGPGIGTEDTTRDMLHKLLQEAADQPKRREERAIGFAGLRQQPDAKATDNDNDDQRVELPPLVLDADALNLLAGIEDWPGIVPPNTIITPHPGEMARLCGIETGDVQANRAALALEKAAAWGVVVVLKGAHTVIAAPDGRLTVLPFKTDALATAGTGDVLAGAIVSLLGQKLAPFDAAVAGAYIHGGAGQHAAATLGSAVSVVAGDVLGALSAVLRDLLPLRP